MNWIKENKFLAVFFAVVLAGALALGFLLYTAYGHFSEVSEDYSRQATELKRLQALAPYRSEANLKKMRDQKDAYAEAIKNLQQSLSAIEFPVEPMRPEDFQDNLRKTVSAIVEKAAQSGTKLPEKFYMGFDVYQAAPPRSEAAGPLGRQLKAIEYVVNELIGAKADAITALKRTPLPEEGAAGAKPPQGAKPSAKLVLKYPFDISFVAEQGRFRKFLNDVVKADKQFYIVRLLRVKNPNEKGPSRTEESAAGAAPAPAEPAGAPGTVPQTAGAAALKFIVGTERPEVNARIDLVDFVPPAAKK